jgi:hypothetical protein
MACARDTGWHRPLRDLTARRRGQGRRSRRAERGLPLTPPSTVVPSTGDGGRTAPPDRAARAHVEPGATPGWLGGRSRFNVPSAPSPPSRPGRAVAGRSRRVRTDRRAAHGDAGGDIVTRTSRHLIVLCRGSAWGSGRVVVMTQGVHAEGTVEARGTVNLETAQRRIRALQPALIERVIPR